MKKLIILFLLCFSGILFAQEQLPKATETKDTAIYVDLEEMPEYPGGTEALFQFIGTNLKYPEEASRNAIQGKVIVSFVVEKAGNVNNVEVIKGSGTESLDAEAVRVVKLLSGWIPGQLNGRVVRTKLTLPIIFKINS